MGKVFTDDIHAVIYEDFEKEFLESIEHVFVDDSQQNTYSIANAAFILKVGSEIEGIAKTICWKNGKHKDGHKFDYNCIPKNKPQKEAVVLLSNVFHFDDVRNTILFPFEKNEKRTDGNGTIYDWDNAYQNLKHGTLEHIQQYGTIKYMLRSLAALYLLNYALTNKFLNSRFFCHVFGEDKIVGRDVCLVADNLIKMSDEQKEYLKSKSGLLNP